MLIILLGLVPLFFLKGLSGAFFPPVAIAYGIAVVVSAIVAIVLAPALALLLYPADAPSEATGRPASAFSRKVSDGYRRALSGMIRAPAIAFIATALFLLVGIGAYTQLNGGAFLPDVRERNLLVEWAAAPGVSHPEMTRVLNRTVNQLAALPGIKNIGSHGGRAITSDRVANINAGEIWLTLAPDADYNSTVKAIKTAIKDYAGLGLKLQTYQQRQSDVMMSGAKDSLFGSMAKKEISSISRPRMSSRPWPRSMALPMSRSNCRSESRPSRSRSTSPPPRRWA